MPTIMAKCSQGVASGGNAHLLLDDPAVFLGQAREFVSDHDAFIAVCLSRRCG